MKLKKTSLSQRRRDCKGNDNFKSMVQLLCFLPLRENQVNPSRSLRLERSPVWRDRLGGEKKVVSRRAAENAGQAGRGKKY